jgi:hypothetical protein
MGQFLDAPNATDFECQKPYIRNFESSGEARIARVIVDANAKDLIPDETIAALRKGIDAAIELFARLPNVKLQHVTVFAYNGGSPSVVPDGKPYAVTNGKRSADECYITIFAEAGMGDDLETSVALAREIFHCMQYATLSEAQMNTRRAGGDWWIEGVAEALADLALPGSGAAVDRSAEFAGAVTSHTPLNDMATSATPFFQWMIAKKGVDFLIGFQAAMTTSGGDDAQHAAMRTAMPDKNDWLDFAKAYVDNEISAAGGAGLATPAPEITRFKFSETTEEELTRGPFVLNYGPVEYLCGIWANTIDPEGHAAMKIDMVWQDWPKSVENSAEVAKQWTFVALNTGEISPKHDLTATLETPCGDCQGSEKLDKCLVGTWVMKGGGPVEYLRQMGMADFAQIEASEMMMRLAANGGYSSVPMNINLEAQTDQRTVTGNGNSTGSIGKWSAEAGVLNICPSFQMATAEASTSDGVNFANAFDISKEISVLYSCVDATLTTTIEIGDGLPPMTTIFARD